MEFKLDIIKQPIYIKSYENNLINILNNNKIKTITPSGCIIFFDKIIENWNSENLNLIIDNKPEIIILATGNKLLSFNYSYLEVLYKSKIPFEVMTTINACRTYNLLASEHRAVALGFI